LDDFQNDLKKMGVTGRIKITTDRDAWCWKRPGSYMNCKASGGNEEVFCPKRTWCQKVRFGSSEVVSWTSSCKWTNRHLWQINTTPLHIQRVPFIVSLTKAALLHRSVHSSEQPATAFVLEDTIKGTLRRFKITTHNLSPT
jgi:hypothetical protein